jgi:hypothetical protein
VNRLSGFKLSFLILCSQTFPDFFCLLLLLGHNLVCPADYPVSSFLFRYFSPPTCSAFFRIVLFGQDVLGSADYSVNFFFLDSFSSNFLRFFSSSSPWLRRALLSRLSWFKVSFLTLFPRPFSHFISLLLLGQDVLYPACNCERIHSEVKLVKHEAVWGAIHQFSRIILNSDS